MEQIKRILTEDYQLEVRRIRPTPGGWASTAYIAQTDTAEYFVKVYDKQRPSVQPWIDRMELYMPAVLWLYAHTPLRDRMIAPLLTRSRTYKAETGRHILLVFPMLHGKAPGDSRLTAEQVRQLAVILAQLHQYGNEIPVSTTGLQEDYTLPFLRAFAGVWEPGNRQGDLHKALSPYERTIGQGVETLQELAERLGGDSPGHVLCHTDIHGWNLMGTNKIMLIDWEGLRLAPAEADLFSFTEGFFFGYAEEAFFSAYRGFRTDYVQDQNAMRFYRLRRRLEDIAEFAVSIARDELSPQGLAEAFAWMKRECEALSQMLRQGPRRFPCGGKG